MNERPTFHIIRCRKIAWAWTLGGVFFLLFALAPVVAFISSGTSVGTTLIVSTFWMPLPLAFAALLLFHGGCGITLHVHNNTLVRRHRLGFLSRSVCYHDANSMWLIRKEQFRKHGFNIREVIVIKGLHSTRIVLDELDCANLLDALKWADATLGIKCVDARHRRVFH